jgi:hypothetical protein
MKKIICLIIVLSLYLINVDYLFALPAPGYVQNKIERSTLENESQGGQNTSQGRNSKASSGIYIKGIRMEDSNIANKSINAVNEATEGSSNTANSGVMIRKSGIKYSNIYNESSDVMNTAKHSGSANSGVFIKNAEIKNTNMVNKSSNQTNSSQSQEAESNSGITIQGDWSG